jgi:glycosyltransferase involved in cell wall biosynthesis
VIPRLSIITASFNRAALLAEAIASVRTQSAEGIEHWIIDGGSTDGTADLLARHPHLQVIREPDRGVYDALNKGLRAATGEIVALLNSDDLFAPGAFAAAREAFADPQVDVVTGSAEIFSDDGVLEKTDDPTELWLNWKNVTLGNPLPNARFYRRTLLQQTGEFDLRFRLASDRDWLLRMARLQPREVVLDAPVYHYRRHAGSLTINDHSRLAEPMWRESIAIADAWLARADLTGDERATLRAWRRQQCIQASLHFLRHGPRKKAGEFMRLGAADPAWAAEWLRGLGQAMAGLFGRR